MPMNLMLGALALGSGGGDAFRLSNATVAENTATGTTIGILSASEQGTWTPTLTGGLNAGGRVAISGTNLQTTATPFNYETATSYTIQVTWTRSANPNDGATRVRTFNITVTNVFEITLGTPTIADNEIGLSLDEDDLIVAISGTQAGSTLTWIGDPAVKLSGTNFVRGPGAVSDGDAPTGFLREVNADANPGSALTPFTFDVIDDLTSPVTLDPAHLNAAKISLDAAKLVATNLGGIAGGVGAVAKATVGVAVGEKKVFEAKCDTWAFGGMRIGGALSTFASSGDTGAFDNLGQNTSSATVLGGLGFWRYNGSDTAITSVANSPGNWIQIQVDNTTSPGTATVYNAAGTQLGTTLTLPTGIVYPAMEFSSNGPSTCEFNFGDNALASNTDADGKKWFCRTPTSGYTALVGGAGGGGSSLNAANASELIDRLGNATGGETINLTTAGGAYGNITLTNRTYSSTVTVQYTGGGTRPIVDYIDLTNTNHLALKGFQVKRLTNGYSGVIDTGSHHITFDDLAVLGANVRDAGTGAITFNGSAISSSNYVGLIQIVDSSDITVRNCTFSKTASAVNIIRSTDVTVQGNAWSDHYGDGLDISGAGSDNINVISNTFTTFYYQAGDHPDCMQMFSLGLTGAQQITNISFIGNTFTRGVGHGAQFIFCGSEESRNLPGDHAWYSGILFQNNSSTGSFQNCIGIGCADNVTFDNNTAQALLAADPGGGGVTSAAIFLEDSTNVVITNNDASGWVWGGFNTGTSASSTTPPNSPTTYVTTASGNTTIAAI